MFYSNVKLVMGTAGGSQTHARRGRGVQSSRLYNGLAWVARGSRGEINQVLAVNMFEGWILRMMQKRLEISQ
jgi:hypothetical protein